MLFVIFFFNKEDAILLHPSSIQVLDLTVYTIILVRYMMVYETLVIKLAAR